MENNAEELIQQLKKKVKNAHHLMIAVDVIYFVISFPFLCMKIEYMEEGLLYYVILGGYIIISFLVIFFMVMRYDECCNRYGKAFKEAIIPEIMNSCFEQWEFQPEKGYEEEKFVETGIQPFTSIIEFKSSDWIEGVYKGVSFQQADLMIRCMGTLTTKKDLETVMDGEMLRIHNPKYAERPVFVATNCDFRLFNMTFQSVELEDREFNLTYSASAENKEDIFYHLTPPMMERMMELARIDRGVMFVFNKEYLYVLRDGRKGAFHVNFKGNVEEDIKNAYEDMHQIQQIIDCMLPKNK